MNRTRMWVYGGRGLCVSRTKILFLFSNGKYLEHVLKSIFYKEQFSFTESCLAMLDAA